MRNIKSGNWKCFVFLERPFRIGLFLWGLSVVSFMPAYSQQFENDIAAMKGLSLEQLMNLEVTSVSKHPEKLQNTSSAIQVITQKDIHSSGATNVPEALRLAPNLQVAQVNSSQWAISARGFNNVLSNKLLVLIDGRVVYTPLYAGVFWDVQNLLLEDIDRIEVISGPGGTMWGANAVNGVINIITKSAKDTHGLYVEYAKGTVLPGLGSVRYGGKIGEDISYRVYGTTFKRGNTHFQDSVESNDDWQMAQGGMRVDWGVEKDRVSVQANLYSGRPDPDSGAPVVARGTNVLGRWNHKQSPYSDFQVQLYYDQTWRDFRNGFSEKLRTYDIEGHHRVRLGARNELTYGIGFRAMEHNVNNLELFAFLPAQKSLYLANVFIQDVVVLIPEALRFSLGVKVEHNTYTDFQYQPNARLNWTPAPNVTVWGAASRAVRNPARIDREFFLSLTPELPLVSGSDFQSAEVWAYELGWHLQPEENFSLSLASFYNRYDDLRGVSPGPPPFGIPLTYVNAVRGDTYGLELSTTYHLNDWWRIRGGYTYLKKDLVVKKNHQDLNNATVESNDPGHQLLLQSVMDLPENIELGAVVRYVDELPMPYVDDYVGLDLRLGWRIHKSIEVSVVGQNLLQKSHTEFIPEAPEPKHIERSVYAKIAGRF